MYVYNFRENHVVCCKHVGCHTGHVVCRKPVAYTKPVMSFVANMLDSTPVMSFVANLLIPNRSCRGNLVLSFLFCRQSSQQPYLYIYIYIDICSYE